MKHLSLKSLDTSFVRPDTPMFVDVIEHLDRNPDLFDTRTRDLISGLRLVAKALGRSPEDTPADPRWLQPRLKAIVPAALGVSAKSWANTLSNAKAGLARFGVIAPRNRRKADLSPEWRRLWAFVLASDNPTLKPALCRFVHFLSTEGISPNEVSEASGLAYRDGLIANEISKSPDVSWRAAVNGWNQATRLLPEWPQIVLTLPKRQKRVAVADDVLPASLHADVNALVNKLERPDPLDGDGRAQALRPNSIRQYRYQLHRFAGELVASGVPPHEITSIAAMCAPDMMERGLRQMLSRNDNKINKSISETGRLLGNLAQTHCGVSDAALAKITKLAGRVMMKSQTGMTRKNRDRLRVLQDERNQLRVIQLPERLFNQAKAGRKPYYRALDREIALAIAILLVCPIRVKNLSEIHLEKSIQRPGDGRVFLVFSEEEVKNSQHIEHELPPDVAAMLDRHLKSRCPELCPPGSPWLFPRRHGLAPMTPGELSGRIGKTILRETGLVMNGHLFRHFAVMIWLDAKPGAYEAARRLLGHSSVSHTINLYSGLEGRSAIAAFSELIATKKGTRK